eukprot:CAMPEP_0204913250 /NCGR_PEP_ID=MMETSP1397-20131031/11196_1 /ASSEMBLY_ACC=CAM_ASM_000891 /TAXON_ID=49980 /ORGANISM="Climacostomum Climacostomum virens, Strain Stock W-24" /LENGTH=869 /DNA_ID=CAMNT_0052084449 /DNA_START=77 /DNA_END=2683 /DNA_ORIENTATION=-
MNTLNSVGISQLLKANSVVSQETSFESTHEKKQPYPGPIGEVAKLDFYHVYRDLVKTKQKNRFKRIEDSPHTAYLLEAERRKLKPLSVGISRVRGNEDTIDIRYRLIGDNYAKALSKGMKHVQTLEHLNLKSNRLSEYGSTSILKRVQPYRLQDLNLADNKLGTSSVAQLIELLMDGRSAIRSLDLESTGVKGKLLTDLCAAVSENHSLKTLSLAKNNLGEDDAVTIGHMLSLNNSLKKLDLHWNGLRGEGAAKLFSEGLKANDFLVELDLSFNALGACNTMIAEALGSALHEHARLAHLDLSFNYFNEAETKIISAHLEGNHDLFGLHYEGNDGVVDARGFIKVQACASNSGHAHTFRRMFGEKSKLTSERNCWICHGWKEMKFSWRPGDSGSASVEPIYIHLECDDYLPESLPLVGDEYTVTRIVPEATCNFFFSFKGSPMISEIIPSHTGRAIASCTFWPGFSLDLDVEDLNYMTPSGPSYSITAPLKTKPRTPPYVYIPPEAEKEKIPWSIPISLFKEYKFDVPDLYMKCFEFDWSCCKIPKIIKDGEELAKIKEILRHGYKHIKESYKYFSAIGSSGSVPSVGLNVFTEFANSFGLMDGVLMNLADLDFNLKGALFNEVKNNPRNPANSLVRYQFMEIIVRLALDKYLRKKVVTSPSEAVQKMLTEDMWPILSKYDSNKWRWDRYICEDVDLAYKAHKPILDNIWSRFSIRLKKPGQKNFMCLEEFTDICTTSGLVNEFFVAREIDVCYNLAMMTQVDELNYDRFREMSFVEFLEALGRACEESSMPPLGEPITDTCKQQPLFRKIENAMPYLLRICPHAIQDMYPHLKISTNPLLPVRSFVELPEAERQERTPGVLKLDEAPM